MINAVNNINKYNYYSSAVALKAMSVMESASDNLSPIGKKIKETLNSIIDKSIAAPTKNIQEEIQNVTVPKVNSIKFSLIPHKETHSLVCFITSGNASKTTILQQGSKAAIKKFISEDANISKIEEIIRKTPDDLNAREYI